MIGKRFGKLVVIDKTKVRQNNHVVWHCRCDCGNDHRVIGSVLRAELSKSCGCWRQERLIKHGGKGTRLYQIWKNMRTRCNNPNRPKYKNWGGRGIKIVREWGDFAKFREWALKNGYSDILTIDRVDNDGPYSPDNCQWVTNSENTRRRHEQNKVKGIRRNISSGTTGQ